MTDVAYKERSAFSGPSSGEPQTPHHSKQAMLTVDFSTPAAAAPPRADRLKQMTANHPAFDRSRLTQEILVRVQHALRRMPGVSGQDANELVTSLQEVGQIVNQETTQLVDALMNLSLDQEDSEQAMARMSLEANLAQAQNKDQAQLIHKLRTEARAEQEKRGEAEAAARTALDKVDALAEELKRVKESVNKTADDLVQVGESASRPGSPRRQQDRRVTPSWGPVECRQVVRREPMAADSTTTPIRESEMAFVSGPVRVASAFQSLGRTPVGPPKFGPLQTGGGPAPPRAPASMTHDRRFQQTGAGASWGRSVSGGGALQQSSLSSSSSRFQPLPRYRPGDVHHHHGSLPPPPPQQQQQHHHNHNHHHHNPPYQNQNQYQYQHHHHPHNSNSNNNNNHNQQHSSFGPTTTQNQHSVFATPQDLMNRPATCLGPRRDYYPTTPTSAAGRSRFRFHDGFGPAIQLTDRAIGAWSEHIGEFYKAIRHFVTRHAGEADCGGAALQVGALWPVLLAIYHPLSEHEATSYLDFHLRNETSKACVVTRVVVDYVVNRVWVAGAWTGSDTKTTYELMELERELDTATGQSSTARQPLLNQQASLIGHIMKKEQGTAWHRHKMEDVSRQLQMTLQPLLNRFINHGEARRDLDRVAELAWELSSKMLTSRLTFDFRFPDIGARYSSQSMLPIWPRLDPAELQTKHWRVAFVTTPVITCRNDTGAGISAHSVALADVFCMQ